MLYEMIVLRKDMEKGVLGKPSAIKQALLFDPLSIVIKEKTFWSKAEFDEKFLKSKKPLHCGNYSHYQRDIVRGIIGQ